MQKNETRIEKRSRRSWYFYDFGNSAYASIILLAVYSVFFQKEVVGGAQGTFLWGLSVGIAAILVAVASPFLGALADVTKHKKKFLMGFTLLSVVFTALLFFVKKGDAAMGMIFFILAEIGYRGAQVFYDALLSDVSTPENVNSVSGKGWAIGMLGGIIALLVVLPTQLPNLKDALTPYAFLICAAFFLLSAIPTFLYVREKQPEVAVQEKVTIGLAFKRIAQTFHAVKSYKEFIKYTFAYLIYNDGIMMLMDFAGIIGGILFGLDMMQLVILVCIIQASGAAGAYLFGRYADKENSKRSALLSLFMLAISISGLFFIGNNTILFYAIGFLAGFFLSGAQAVSRSMVVQIAPPEKLTEFCGFLSVAGRTSTAVGPLVFGTLTKVMYDWYTKRGPSEVVTRNANELW